MTSTPETRLRRTLSLRDLILYGVIVIQPVAPMGVYGVLSERSHNQVVTTILLAMVAMLFTAISYGRMARAYPSAGSAFTYVSREIHPAVGYATGWSMVMDYILNPMICIIWCSQQAHVFLPALPYPAYVLLFGTLFTAMTLQGVKASANFNKVLVSGMGIIIVLFFVLAARAIMGQHAPAPNFFLSPFYDPARWNLKAVLGGTSVAVLTYIGFDGISTLSEEVENPKRNILLATVLTCVTIGLLSALEVYAAQLVWPAARTFANVDTAFVEVAAYLWRPMLGLLGGTLLIANMGSGMAAQLGAARLLYGMSRNQALPQSFFAYLDKKNHIPRNNVLLIGVIATTGALLTSYALGAEMLNYGALIAFMGVNIAAFLRYFVRTPEKKVTNIVPPLAGFVICLLLWLNLSHRALFVGSLWLTLGMIYGAWRTRGFRRNISSFDSVE